MPAFPQIPITSESILVVVGNPAQLIALDSVLETTPHSEAAVLVIGAGTVGRPPPVRSNARASPSICSSETRERRSV